MAATIDIRPNHTIYINNLNEKVKKEGLSVLVLSFSITYELDLIIIDAVEFTSQVY